MSSKSSAPEIKVIDLPIDRLRTDGGTQPRTDLDEKTLKEYAADYKAGDAFPPVRAVFDGKFYWLYDGFHRTAAQRRNHARQVRVEVREGTQNDAVWLGAGANREHGLRRSNEAKRSAVLMALASAAKMSPQPSSRQIAKHVGVSHPTVEKYREDPTGKIYQSAPRTGADGRTRKLPSGAPGAEATAEAEGPVLDALGQVITYPGIADVFRHLRPRLLEVAEDVAQGRRHWGKFHREQLEARRSRILQSKQYSFIRPKVEEELKQRVYDFQTSAPYTICPYCKGAPAPADITQRCEGCGGGGWIDKFGYDHAPPEMKVKGSPKVARHHRHEAGHA